MEFNEEDATEDEYMMELMNERSTDPEAFMKKLDNELNVFKEGEEYDFVTDMKMAYAESLSKSNVQQIMSTLPDHVFWDIKAPLHKPWKLEINKWNPWRGGPLQRTFFEIRDWEKYNKERYEFRNIDRAISHYRRF